MHRRKGEPTPNDRQVLYALARWCARMGTTPTLGELVVFAELNLEKVHGTIVYAIRAGWIDQPKSPPKYKTKWRCPALTKTGVRLLRSEAFK